MGFVLGETFACKWKAGLVGWERRGGFAPRGFAVCLVDVHTLGAKWRTATGFSGAALVCTT